jgi:hypothetical protein
VINLKYEKKFKWEMTRNVKWIIFKIFISNVFLLIN